MKTVQRIVMAGVLGICLGIFGCSGNKTSTGGDAHDDHGAHDHSHDGHDHGDHHDHDGHDHGDHKHTDGKHDDSHDHSHHEPGPHGGTVVDWGGGAYHIELAVDREKQEAAVYILGKDAKTATTIEASKLVLTLDKPRVQIELAPEQAEGGTAGASKFVGRHESLGSKSELSGSIQGEVAGVPYVGDFHVGASISGGFSL